MLTILLIVYQVKANEPLEPYIPVTDRPTKYARTRNPKLNLTITLKQILHLIIQLLIGSKYITPNPRQHISIP